MMKYKRLILGFGAMLAIFAGGVAMPAQVMAAGDGCGIIDFTGVSCSQEADPKDKGDANISGLLIGFRCWHRSSWRAYLRWYSLLNR